MTTNSCYIKSPLNYMGGKYRILNEIMPLLTGRNTEVFYDVFAGGFNVGINSDASKIVCNDQITYLIDMFQVFSTETFDDLMLKINERISTYNLSKTNAKGYNALREHYNNSKNTLDLFVLTCFSFNHQIRFNSNHKLNVPFGKNRSAFNKSIKNNLKNFTDALHKKKVEFLTKDFRELDYNKLTKNDLAYFDPPYLISTGTYNDGKRGFNDWGEAEEKELLCLLDFLDSRGIAFALSNVMYNKGLSNDLLIKWAKNYQVHYINNSFANCSYHYKDRTKETVEVLITNY